MIQLACGIARAHDLDVVHRDLKPENVVITQREDGTDLLKVLDFGIARSLHDPRLTEQGELFGTPQYMAPERIANADSGPSTDLYALGVMFYEMVTGQLPFDASDITTFFVKHLKDPPPDPRKKNDKVPAKLAELILTLLAKDPKARPVDAHRVHNDLIAIAKDAGFPIPPDPTADPASSRRVVTSRMPEAARRWRRRLRTIEQIVDQYPDGLEGGYERLGILRGKIARLAEFDDLRVEIQGRVEAIAAMGHESRQRYGHAVDALGLDVSRARDDERAAKDALESLKAATSGVRAAYLVAHKEVSFWEGRSGFTEPYTDLVLAYRAAASAMEAWVTSRESEKKLQREAEMKSRAVTDLEFQVQELRTAFASHERAHEAQEDILARELEKAGKDSEAIERELGDLAEALTAPMRGRADVAPMFRELDMSL
ncbi:MAG: serine/threonine protein kinase [Myxococcales bacterium]|nr:serine/threonine protein kinase [Myxococcales bacterium]